jgi:D-arginine dehydrogenase
MDRTAPASSSFLVLGGGIAGLSAAAELVRDAGVTVLERERALGVHATGRSAALWSCAQGTAAVRALTVASGAFLRAPPAGFADVPLTRPRGVLYVAAPGRDAALAPLEGLLASARAARAALGERASGPARLPAGAVRERVRALRESAVGAALHDPDVLDLDAELLLQGYARAVAAGGGRVVRNAEVVALARRADRWVATTAAGDEYEAGTVVNAAGAWADELAALAGARRLCLEPRRRTALLVPPAPYADVGGWPAVGDAEGTWYFKPDAGQLLVSPADATPCAAGDAQPEEWDVAVALDRLAGATDLALATIGRRWAGLRTFAPDESPVVGPAPDAPGFFWLAGQGGAGLQTAPALARAAAALALGRPWPADLARLGLHPGALSPARFG